MSKIYRIARSATIAAMTILGLAVLAGSSGACEATVYAPKRVVHYQRALKKTHYQLSRYNHWSDVYHLRNSGYRHVRPQNISYTRGTHWLS